MSRAAAQFGGVRPSPNIWQHPEIYEWENLAFDPDGLVEPAIESLRPLRGARVLDIGCGTGFHLPRYAAAGAQVLGVEPHPPLLALARARLAAAAPDEAERALGELGGGANGIPAVAGGEAERLPVADHSVDVALARWAYFFGPGCEPGLSEVARVLRPGGLAAFLDNDATRSTFGRWFSAAHPAYDAAGVARFWRRQGFTALPLDARWECPDRDHFAALVGIEFEPAMAERILAEHSGTSVDYAVTLWWRRY